jgi:hypothetical protein
MGIYEQGIMAGIRILVSDRRKLWVARPGRQPHPAAERGGEIEGL